MSTQVDRLQTLLQRVQDNRQKPQLLAMGQAVPAEPNRAPAPAARAPAPVVPAPAAPAAPVHDVRARASAPEARPKQHAATPLEIAVEGRISQPVRAESPQRPPLAAPPPQGVVLADAGAMQPSKPIAHVVSPHPPAVALSFGELLRRSLALRPH